MSRALTTDRVFHLLGVATGLAALAALGCGGAATPATKQTATSAVTPESGGTVTLADESAKLDVPAGAVSATTTITVTTTDATPPAGITADSAILQFDPDGTVFARPVTVTFTFKNATSPVVFWSNASGGYDVIEGTVTGSTIAAPVMHFSKGFVGERPTAATCGEGVACARGATCGYGGGSSGGTATDKGGNPSGAVDASAPGPTSGSTNPAPKPSMMSALSKTPPSDDAGASPGGSNATCCSCGTDGLFHCVGCQGGGVADGGAAPCAEGAACGKMGSACNSTAGSTATGSGAPNASGGSSADVPPAGGSTCCLCGADGAYHCGASCASVGADGSASTGGGGATGGGAGGATGGDGTCVQGAACRPGSSGCGSASPTSCQMCTCGANGALDCAPCPNGSQDGGMTSPPPPPDAGTGTQSCAPGLACTGAGGCTIAKPAGGCAMCQCTGGTYACAPCAGADDAGAPPPPPPSDAGAQAPQQCAPGLDCAQPGAMCGNASPTSCMKCTCGTDHTLTCAPC